MKPFHYVVKVTQQDIDKGEAGTCASCPIALSLKRLKGEWTAIWMGVNLIHIACDIHGERHYKFAVSQAVRDFRRKFDEYGIGKPFSFIFSSKNIVTR